MRLPALAQQATFQTLGDNLLIGTVTVRAVTDLLVSGHIGLEVARSGAPEVDVGARKDLDGFAECLRHLSVVECFISFGASSGVFQQPIGNENTQSKTQRLGSWCSKNGVLLLLFLEQPFLEQ